jgi:hypothetical protein
VERSSRRRRQGSGKNLATSLTVPYGPRALPIFWNQYWATNKEALGTRGTVDQALTLKEILFQRKRTTNPTFCVSSILGRRSTPCGMMGSGRECGTGIKANLGELSEISMAQLVRA